MTTMYQKTCLCLLLVVLAVVSSSGKTIKMKMPMDKTVKKGQGWKSPAPRMKGITLPLGSHIRFFETEVDHFGFSIEKKFKMKYIINRAFWKHGGPIFFYTGNEGSIELFANNTGFMWENAPAYHAMLVFAEHRYYGVSMPFGADSFKDRSKFGYLTAEQALADYAELLRYLKTSIKGAASSPVIAIGGSYGGMLAAWMRQKYPNIIAGALAASAPVLMFTGEEQVGCDGFNLILTHSYIVVGSSQCVNRIRASWNAIFKTKLGKLAKDFRLCAPLKSHVDLINWLEGAITDMGMANYPYPTTFLANLPAWPVKAFCDNVVRGSNIIDGMVRGSQVYFNSSGKATCLNISESQSPSLGASGWDYQSCMEMVMPICAYGKTDMFTPSPWKINSVIANCQQQFGVTPRPVWIPLQYAGKPRIAGSSSNILFSNGALDPWAAGGIQSSPDPNHLPVIVIKDGAHHLDLRHSNPLDPASVKAARKFEKAWISRWIKEWK